MAPSPSLNLPHQQCGEHPLDLVIDVSIFSMDGEDGRLLLHKKGKKKFNMPFHPDGLYSREVL